jgi:hypothetical protein
MSPQCETNRDGTEEIHRIDAIMCGTFPMLPSAAIDAAIKDIDSRIS